MYPWFAKLYNASIFFFSAIWLQERWKTSKWASHELKARQMLGNPQGINRHIKHNIISCTGVQSLPLSGELLHYVLLPQFKSQELETNAPQTGSAHAKRTLGSSGWLESSVQKAETVFLFVSSSKISSESCIWYLWGDKHQIFYVGLQPSTQYQ